MTAVEVPSDAKAYAEWRSTGKLPQAESAPAKKPSDTKAADNAVEGEGDGRAPEAADSETENHQGRKPGKAETRLNELLAQMREAGLSPSELKDFKKQYQRVQQQEQTSEKPAAEKKPVTEHTEKPQGLEPPKKPVEKDFKTWEEYEAARDKYVEDLAEFKANAAVEKDRAERRREAAEREMAVRLNAAKTKYKDDNADKTIVETAKEVFNDKTPVPAVIREVLNESEHLVDVLYVLGSDGEALGEFLDLCKTAPGKAMRKAILIEKLVMDELDGKGGGEKPAAETKETPTRGSDGKFVAPKKETKAPPPPRETSGRSGPVADERERAIESGDFASYRDAANRRDLARFQGR